MSVDKKLKNNIFIVGIIVYVILFLTLIVNSFPNQSITINGLVVALLAFLAYIFYGFQNYNLNKLRKNLIVEVFVGLAIYFTVIFVLGIFTGFLKNGYSQNILSVFKNMTIPLISVVALELFRYIFISSNREKTKYIILGFICFTLLDILINYKNVGSTNYDIFVFISVTVLPLIFKNAALSYLTYQAGYQPSMVYSITLCLYKFMVPVVPDLGNYLTCILDIALPSMLFFYAVRMVNEFLSGKINNLKVIKDVLFTIPLILLFTILVGLVSGYFIYHLIGVNTSAISPIVKRGDAVMIYKGADFEQINVGDIIAFRVDDEIVIDKVIDRQDTDEGTKIYVKEVINEEDDDSNRLITKDNFIGTYKFKIPAIAYPTIWFKDYIGGGD